MGQVQTCPIDSAGTVVQVVITHRSVLYPELAHRLVSPFYPRAQIRTLEAAQSSITRITTDG
jgi:hypothetical protein